MEKITRILIVDDDIDFIEALKETLENESYSVFAASNHQQAEEMVRSYEPDMIVLGTIMPRGDSFRFHKWMKQTLGFSNLPIMVVNAPPEKQILKGWRLEDEVDRVQCHDQARWCMCCNSVLSDPVQPL